MLVLPFGRDYTHLIGAETFDGDEFVMVIEEFGVDGRVWEEEAIPLAMK